jgi:hypothetical protein
MYIHVRMNSPDMAFAEMASCGLHEQQEAISVQNERLQANEPSSSRDNEAKLRKVKGWKWWSRH